MFRLFPYLDQEEGHSVGLERAGQFDVADFGLDLSHVLAVLVGLLLKKNMQYFLHTTVPARTDR